MPSNRLKVGDTLRAAGTAFDANRGEVIRLTLLFAVLSAASALLDIAGPAGLAISFWVTILLGASYSGMVTALICLPGRSEGIGELWTAVKPVLARLIWVTLVTAIALILGLAAFIVPGLVIVTVWSVAGQTVVVERTSVFEALGRSFDLVRDNGWRVFGYLLVLGLISLLMLGLSLLVSAPLGTGLLANLVASFLSNLLSTPVLAIGSAVLYSRLAELNRQAAPDDSGSAT